MRTSESCIRPALPMRHLALMCAALGLATSAYAEHREFGIVPSVRVTETLTDNAWLTKSSDAQSDWITQINPAVRFDADSARIKGNLSLGVNSALYGNGTHSNSNQTLINGAGKLTAWENYAFVDLVASVSRQPVSAFRPTGGDTVTGNNWTEVRLFQATPYVKGHFGSTGTVEARYSLTDTDSSSSVINRTKTNVLSLNANDARAFGDFGWSFGYSDSHTQRTAYRDIDHTTARLNGIVTIDPQLTLRVIGGTERNNYSAVTTTTSLYGGGVDWFPSQVSKLSATVEHRFFGTGYNITGEHRGSPLVFNGSYSKDVSSTSQSLLGAVSLYDLLMMRYAALIPDPVARAAYVRNLIDTSFPGLGGSVVAAQSVLSNGFYLDRRAQLGMSYVGPRDTLSLIFFRSDRTTLTQNDFAVTSDTSTTSSMKSTGVTVTLQHKITPITSANVSYTGMRSHTETTTTSTRAVDSRSRTITAGLSTSFTPKTTGSITVRNSQGSGSTSYSENALYGSILFQF